MTDLFQVTNTQGVTQFKYPEVAGYKKEGTSQKAVPTRQDARRLRDLVLAALGNGPATADELAEELGRTPFAVRPRCSELLALNLIRETTTRRPNRSGKLATVLELNTQR